MNLRNEISRRYTLRDWLISSRIAKLIGQSNADEVIRKVINDKSPALVGRLGGTEARFIGEFLKMSRYERFGVPLEFCSTFNLRWKKRVREIRFNAGFKPSNWGEVQQFVRLYQECMENTDVLGAWGTAFAWAESLAFSRTNSPTVISIGSTSPWVDPTVPKECVIPWGMALEGKRVLVVAGFADSIEKQHRSTKKIFQDVDYPNFTLNVIAAPLSAARDSFFHDDWFKNLFSMEEQMEKIEFDVALISAGAYSYPLALKAKQLGKIGIHCGGGLQLFFGIMGGRWEQDSNVLPRVNEFWVRPSSSETPELAKGVEGGCYW